ncbi:transporter substrate-binding domain-containing protein [Arcobacteraceae bacterium]|nr:transporter substrate-binding domain-containing protein [Arcobacteraceae bacterium]
MKSLNILFVILLLCINLNSRSLDEIEESGDIIIAVYENFPPYSYLENGVAKGIDIDIANEISKKMGVKPIWYWTGSDENLEDDLRNLIWKGNLIHKTKVDIMFRVPYDYDFIRQTNKSTGELDNELVVIKSPYHSESWVIATNKKTIPEIRNLAIFKFYKIGVEIDTLPDSHLTSSFRGALQSSVKHYININDAIKDLKNGKIDAVAGLKSQLEFGLDYLNNQDKFYISERLRYVKSEWDLGVAVRTDFRALSYRVDGYMNELHQNGTIKKIFSKYNIEYFKPLAHKDLN